MDQDENRGAHLLGCEQQLRVIHPHRREPSKRRHNVEGIPRLFPEEARVQRQIRGEPRRKAAQGFAESHKRLVAIMKTRRWSLPTYFFFINLNVNV